MVELGLIKRIYPVDITGSGSETEPGSSIYNLSSRIKKKAGAFANPMKRNGWFLLGLRELKLWTFQLLWHLMYGRHPLTARKKKIYRPKVKAFVKETTKEKGITESEHKMRFWGSASFRIQEKRTMRSSACNTEKRVCDLWLGWKVSSLALASTKWRGSTCLALFITYMFLSKGEE